MYIIYVYVRLVRVAESDSQIHEHTGSKTGRAQIAVVDPDERACPAAIWRIAKDLHDGLRRMSAEAGGRLHGQARSHACNILTSPPDLFCICHDKTVNKK